MKEAQVVKHANAVNLARRFTTENENDLMQVNFFEEDNEKPATPRNFDHAYCQELSNHLLHPKHLPEECKKFQDVLVNLRRHETDTTPDTADLS